MVCECVLNQPVAAMYLSVWGTHVGSDNNFCMLRAFRRRVLIKVVGVLHGPCMKVKSVEPFPPSYCTWGKLVLLLHLYYEGVD